MQLSIKQTHKQVTVTGQNYQRGSIMAIVLQAFINSDSRNDLTGEEGISLKKTLEICGYYSYVALQAILFRAL